MQKKRMAAIFLILALVFSITASATPNLVPTPRYNTTISCMPDLSFSGTTAYCSFDVTALKGTYITGIMKLYRISGSSETLLKAWDMVGGYTTLSFSDTFTVTKGYSYKLTIDATANGSGGYDRISIPVTAWCR